MATTHELGAPPPPWYPPPGTHAQPRGKKKRRKWPWVLAGCLAAFVLLIVALGAGSPRPPGGVAAAATAATAPLAPAKAISAREWQLIAKDPDAHKGERITVYGEVTQFDAATGKAKFRANVDGIQHEEKYGFVNYPTNTVLAGNEADLADLVQGDLFKAEATVAGSHSYDTQIGGNTDCAFSDGHQNR